LDYFSSMKQFLTAILILCTITTIAQPTWQQLVNSKIDVTLDDKHYMLRAVEELSYTNNSPDTLSYIYMHLWPNAYRNDHTPFARQQDENGRTAFYYSKKRDKGYIDSLQFTIDGYAVDHYSSENAPDVARINLRDPLLPGHTIKITTPFKVKIPQVFSRMGHTDQAFYISQWFPKPAVYDSKGWHPLSYLDQGEFYSEYGSYDVRITLPANYVVMATGNCTDEKENQWLDELAQKPLPTTIAKKSKRHNDAFPESAAEMKTIHFHEDNVHDFAWFADKRFLVRKDTVVSPGNNEIVTAWAAFMPSYWPQWQRATEYLKETVRHYGKWVGPYQYKTIKAVLGDLRAGGGMEYPTVTIIDKSASKQLRLVTVHEAGHNWFYGMLGSNERDHAWMDEGINTFYEQKTNDDIVPDSLKKKKTGLDETMVYYQRAATHEDQAIEQTSANFEKLNYGLDIYFKTAMSLRWLEKYMGEPAFEAGMHDYYDKWHFHHPYPEDFRACMQHHSSKSLDWFFDTILTNDKKIDFTITKARINGDHTDVTIRNKTHVPSPVLIDAITNDTIGNTAWSQPFAGTATISLAGTDWHKLKIDDVIPDGKSANDVYRRHAIFHHFGLQVRPLAGLNLAEKDKLFIAPAVGYNQYDGTMVGLLFHDLTLPENRFRFALAPMYSFPTSSFVGCGSVGYVWYPGNIFKEIMLQADGKTFHYNDISQPAYNQHIYAGYSKVAPSLSFTFKEHDARSPVTRTLTLKGYYIDEEYFDSTFATGAVNPPALLYTRQKHNNYGAVYYSHNNNRTYNPFGYGVSYQQGADFAKLQVAGAIRIDYNTRNKALFVRGYFGKFFAITNTADVISRYQLNANYNGMNDYLYDGTYLARSAQSKLASQQISIQEGGFKVPTLNNAGRSDNWMATINLKSNIPFTRYVCLFLDAGLIPNVNPSFTHNSGTTTLYDAGIEIDIINNFCSFYFPIIMSNDFQNYLTDAYGKKNVFGRSISFTLQFQNINWLRTPSRALKMVAN
jgi:hypothetical protein